MAASYRLTVRVGSKVERERFEGLTDALAELERRGREAEREATGRPVESLLGRRYQPIEQVTARLEIAGRGGVDVRGDGSAEAFTGRVRRRLVDQRDGESAYDALRRELGEG